MSLSDGGAPMMTMPVAPANNYGGGMGMWGDNWIWLIVLFIFGWGRNGWGGNGNNGGGVMDGYVLTSDFASIERKLDSIANGACDSTFALNNTVNTGFASVQNTLTQGFAGVNTGMVTQGYESRLATQGLAAQLASCCCDIREGISGVNYNLAAQSCDTRNQVQNSTRDIIDAMNCGFRSIDQRLTAQELAAKDAKIAEQNQQLFAAQLAASQSAQNDTLKSYVSGQLAYYNPRPVPSFSVPAPYQYAGCNNQYACGGCGC